MKQEQNKEEVNYADSRTLEQIGKDLDTKITSASKIELSSGATPHTLGQEKWEERFEQLFPLQYWATENYPGDSKDGELNFSRWTAKATEMAKFRANMVLQFINSEISKALLLQREELVKKIEEIAYHSTKEVIEFRENIIRQLK
jgi:hypothetical protein